MTKEEMDTIRKRVEASTPGPWVNRPPGIVQVQGGQGPFIFWDDEDNPNKSANYDFIAHSREDVPRLLDEVTRLEAENADLAALVRKLCGYPKSDDARTKAMDYLKRKGLQGSILREGAT